VDLRWIDTPGEKIRADSEFNMTYQLILEDEFWPFAMRHGFLSGPAGLT